MKPLSSVSVTYAHRHAERAGACSEGQASATSNYTPFCGIATRPATSLCIHQRPRRSDSPARAKLDHKSQLSRVYIHLSTTPNHTNKTQINTPNTLFTTYTAGLDKNPIMAYTTDLNNIDPSTQMPSSGEHSALEQINQGEAQQSEPSGRDHARLEVDETLPAIQMPSSEDDRARSTLVATNPAITLRSSESGGTFLMARTEVLRQELKGLGVLSDLQVDKVIEGLVKSASYRTSVTNKAFNMFSALKRVTPNPTPHLDPRAENIVKDKFTTPPPREVTTPSAPRPTISAVPRRRMAPSSKPVSDLAVRVDNLETTIHGLNAIIQYITKHRRPQPPPTFSTTAATTTNALPLTTTDQLLPPPKPPRRASQPHLPLRPHRPPHHRNRQGALVNPPAAPPQNLQNHTRRSPAPLLHREQNLH